MSDLGRRDFLRYLVGGGVSAVVGSLLSRPLWHFEKLLILPSQWTAEPRNRGRRVIALLSGEEIVAAKDFDDLRPKVDALSPSMVVMRYPEITFEPDCFASGTVDVDAVLVRLYDGERWMTHYQPLHHQRVTVTRGDYAALRLELVTQTSEAIG